MISRLRIIVTGLIAQYPLGGVCWDYIQYVLGLSRLGHDTYYFEDTGQWPYNPVDGGVAKDCNFNVAYLSEVMARFDLSDKWAYHFPWESGAITVGEIDLASSTANWPSGIVQKCELEYKRWRWPDRSPINF